MRRSAMLLLAAGLLLLAGGAWAASGGPYTLDWFTVDGGGALDLSGLQYTLAGTAGQADAGVVAGGGYTLAGGFWAGGVAAPPPPPGHGIYLPLVLRS